MSTLLDRLRHSGRFVWLDRPMPLIIGTDVSRLIFGEALDMPSWQTQDIPLLTPPFPEFFVEARVPAHLGGRGPGSQVKPWPHPGISGFGVHFKTFRGESIDELLAKVFNRQPERLPGILELLGGRPALQWVLVGGLYIENFGRDAYLCTERLVFLGDEGQPLADSLTNRVEGMAPYRLASIDDPQGLEALLLYQALYAVCYLTICFLSCRGKVTLTEEGPPPALARKHLKKTGMPLTRFHVLKVGGMEAILRGPGRLGEVGLMQSLHLCRGHFKYYREDHKLFGKHAGLFYWEPQLRGAKSQGVVDKDYAVTGPAAQAVDEADDARPGA